MSRRKRYHYNSVTHPPGPPPETKPCPFHIGLRLFHPAAGHGYYDRFSGTVTAIGRSANDPGVYWATTNFHETVTSRDLERGWFRVGDKR